MRDPFVDHREAMQRMSIAYVAGAREFVTGWCRDHLSRAPQAEFDRIVAAGIGVIDEEFTRRDVWAHLRRRDDLDAWRLGRYSVRGKRSGVPDELADPIRLALGRAHPLLIVVDPTAVVVAARCWSIVAWRDRSRIAFSGRLHWPSDLRDAASGYRSHFDTALAILVSRRGD
ncbi:MAG TPA: hypothetical protein VI916_05475 [Acidimicrobiia bacterium]|nr:hypothetical protein [Acidimicrobiia bacterium]